MFRRNRRDIIHLPAGDISLTRPESHYSDTNEMTSEQVAVRRVRRRVAFTTDSFFSTE